MAAADEREGTYVIGLIGTDPGGRTSHGLGRWRVPSGPRQIPWWRGPAQPRVGDVVDIRLAEGDLLTIAARLLHDFNLEYDEPRPRWRS